MRNESNKVLTDNLLKIYKLRNYSSISDFAHDFCVPSGTLKCWITGNRSPKLTNLDYISNKLGCFTFNLIKENGNFTDIGVRNNDTHQAFTKQLKIIFINNQATTYLNKLYLINNVISYDTLISYLRPNNYRLPTLHTLDKIANELNIDTWELIKEDI